MRTFVVLTLLALSTLVGCGQKTLSRNQAATDLKAHFSKQPGDDIWLSIADYSRDDVKRFECPFEGCPDAPFANFNSLSNGWGSLLKLQKQGLATFTLAGKSAPRTWNGYALFRVALSDEAKKYVLEDVSPGNERKVRLKLRALKDVTVTAVGAPSDMMGQRMSVVSYTVTYETTPIGAALDGKHGDTKKSGQAEFVLNDNGWKLESVH